MTPVMWPILHQEASYGYQLAQLVEDDLTGLLRLKMFFFGLFVTQMSLCVIVDMW